MRINSSFFFLLAGLFLILCGGCAHENPLASNNGNNSPNETAITFTPLTNGAANSVYLKKSSVSDNDLWLQIQADSISSQVLGASFSLVFDGTIIEYLDYSNGDFFPSVALVNLKNSDPGASELVVGVSNLNGSSSGSGTIITLHFRAILQGSSPLTFTESHLQDSQNQEITINGWYGGTVGVTP